ncbi:MAG: alpha/beta hydrolase [Variovorax sp.]|nr:alpha/beta hydrolase [Variovorax sp.]
MPMTRTAPDLETFWRIDDFTDPWRDAPWIVLMHGVAESSDAWYGWIPHLARRYRVLRFDVRGYGKSTAMPRDHAWSLEQIGDDLLTLVARLEIGTFHLVAAKVGGTMALHFASRRPAQLKSLAVLGTPVVTASAVDSGYSSREIDEQGVGHWARRTMRNRLGTSMPAEAQEWWARMMEATPASTQAGFMDFLPTIDVRPVLPHIACPTLVVTTGDPANPAQNITGLEVTRAWQRTIPGSELLVIPDDSFHVAATLPDTAALATLAFIDRHESRASHG